jgi:programmed cell death 8 (apoptosis-inducing factor)
MRPPLSKDIWYTDDDELIQKHSFKQWNGKEKRFAPSKTSVLFY